MPPKNIKVVKKVVDADTAELFNQIIGKEINLEYAWPRYNRLKKIATQLVKLVSIIASTDPVINNATLSDTLNKWILSRNVDISMMFSVTHLDMLTPIPGLIDYDTVPIDQRNIFAKSYEECKKSALFKIAKTWHDALQPHEHVLNTDYNTLKHGQPKPHVYFSVMAGSEWYPLDPLRINFKSLFTCDDEKILQLNVNVLKKILELCKNLLHELHSPDVDVDKFADVIMESIDKLRKIPELSRCTRAFARIKKSIGLLKENFNVYYGDFVDTSDSTIIMQHFIIDVAKNSDADARTMQEFKKLVAYYRKIAEKRNNDPEIAALFQRIDGQFNKFSEASTSEPKIE